MALRHARQLMLFREGNNPKDFDGFHFPSISHMKATLS
jgi:hypothetical protein